MKNNKVFKSYSDYYDLLYKDKDYVSEVNYIHSLLQKNCNNCTRVLDLGCGTGKHDELLSLKGYSVTGVDFSEEMITIAQKEHCNNNTHFFVGDVRKVRLDNKFDAITSLFHVASYQTTNNDIKQFFKTASYHLEKGGLFIFDFWYGPAVLTDPPTYRLKKIENNTNVIRRFTSPEFVPAMNMVKVNFDLLIQNKQENNILEVHEVHNMRYLFLPEIDDLLTESGFDLLNSFKWMTMSPLKMNNWYGVVIARKK